MLQEGISKTWLQQAHRRLTAWVRQLKPFSSSLAPSPGAAYPDYVPCPHCGEPEVEVWCYQAEAHCHNCGQTFEHPLPPGCGPGCRICNGGSLP